MKFLLDESAEFRLASFLHEHGHDVTSIAHDYPRSLTDREVLRIAYQERRILLTNDRDFGDLVFRLTLPHAGIIYFRLGAALLEEKKAWLERILVEYADGLDRFLVITKQGIRVREGKERGSSG